MKNKRKLSALAAGLFLLVSLGAYAAKPAEPAFVDKLYPVDGLAALDMPYDGGGVALLKWSAMAYDGADVHYRIYVARSAEGPWKEAMVIPSNNYYASNIKLPFWAWDGGGKTRHAVPVDLLRAFPMEQNSSIDKSKLDTVDIFKLEEKEQKERQAYQDGISTTPYYFKVAAFRAMQSASGAVVLSPEVTSEVVSAVPHMNWFNLARLNNLVYTLISIAVFLWFISHAKKRELYIRKIPGLDAVDEAIGRATEMGRPIIYQTGVGDMTNVATIASTMILGEVSKKVAQYDATLKVPHRDPTVLPVCQEVVKQAYIEAGRADSYREDINFFLTTDQFAFTAALDGMYAREKPAACFYMGTFFAESMLMTEVGSNAGVIQIAGTDAEHQLPFFFTTCDYTLIGEELYAAGAYLSKEPVLVGTLRAQDVGKLIIVAGVVLAVLGLTIGTIYGWSDFNRVIMDPFRAF